MDEIKTSNKPLLNSASAVIANLIEKLSVKFNDPKADLNALGLEVNGILVDFDRSLGTKFYDGWDKRLLELELSKKVIPLSIQNTEFQQALLAYLKLVETELSKPKYLEANLPQTLKELVETHLSHVEEMQQESEKWRERWESYRQAQLKHQHLALIDQVIQIQAEMAGKGMPLELKPGDLVALVESSAYVSRHEVKQPLSKLPEKERDKQLKGLILSLEVRLRAQGSGIYLNENVSGHFRKFIEIAEAAAEEEITEVTLQRDKERTREYQEPYQQLLTTVTDRNSVKQEIQDYGKEAAEATRKTELVLHQLSETASPEDRARIKATLVVLTNESQRLTKDVLPGQLPTLALFAGLAVSQRAEFNQLIKDFSGPKFGGLIQEIEALHLGGLGTKEILNKFQMRLSASDLHFIMRYEALRESFFNRLSQRGFAFHQDELTRLFWETHGLYLNQKFVETYTAPPEKVDTRTIPLTTPYARLTYPSVISPTPSVVSPAAGKTPTSPPTVAPYSPGRQVFSALGKSWQRLINRYSFLVPISNALRAMWLQLQVRVPFFSFVVRSSPDGLRLAGRVGGNAGNAFLNGAGQISGEISKRLSLRAAQQSVTGTLTRAVIVRNILIVAVVVVGLLTITGSGLTSPDPFTLVSSLSILPAGGEETAHGEIDQSQYFSVSKSANPSSISNSSLPAQITYTVSVNAKADLTNIRFQDSTMQITNSGTSPITTDANGQSITTFPSQSALAKGQSYSFTYTIQAKTQDALISDSIVAIADVPEKNLTDERSSATATVSVGTPPAGFTFDCADSGASVIAPGAEVKLLPPSSQDPHGYCIIPSMIVIHWSGGVANDAGNDATYDTLVVRQRSCQIATDTNNVLQMQPLWEKKAALAWCVGEDNNNYAVNNELAGAWFDTNPPPDSEINLALDNTCWYMQQYHITVDNIRGHFELWPGKHDPGVEFLRHFKELVRARCGG